MVLKIKHEIDNNVFTTGISVVSLGTEQLLAEEEEELLKDFPIKLIYRNLTFTRNVKISGNKPVVTSDAVGEGVVSVTVPSLSNQEIPIDKDFATLYKSDTNKIANTALDENVLTTKELVAQARCAVFEDVVCEEIASKMTEIRGKAPAFIGENDITV